MTDLPMFGQVIEPVAAAVEEAVAEVEAVVEPVAEELTGTAKLVSDAVDKWFHDHVRGSILAQNTENLNHIFFGLDRLKTEVVSAVERL
jgi:hypothetical protein